MRNNINTKIGGSTDVKGNKVIDYKPLETKDRSDDEAWDSLKFLGESDTDELNYTPKAQELNKLMKRLNKTELGAKLIRFMNAA